MSQRLDVSAYTVGWVCATKDEVTASRVLLDEEHERPPKQPNDDNGYILCRMEKHYVVIAFPGAGTYGADVIAQATAHMVRTFQNVRFGLMVGIGGGAPSKPDPRDPSSDKVTAQLPPNYLSMPHIAACPDADERSTRLYRIAEVFQLKIFLYLPLFLQQCDPHTPKLAQGQMVRYGRTACLSSARSLLEVYLVLYDMEPTTAIVDNSMKLASFTAVTAAVVLFLNLLAGSHPTMETMADSAESSTWESDTMLIS